MTLNVSRNKTLWGMKRVIRNSTPYSCVFVKDWVRNRREKSGKEKIGKLPVSFKLYNQTTKKNLVPTVYFKMYRTEFYFNQFLYSFQQHVKHFTKSYESRLWCSEIFFIPNTLVLYIFICNMNLFQFLLTN